MSYSYIYEKPEGTKILFAMMTYEHHIPVLLKETLALLEPRDGETYVDCTFGAGGHTRCNIEVVQTAEVISIDRDPQVQLTR
jgi:16S rRNA C1402 N4-methylase RsmH